MKINPVLKSNNIDPVETVIVSMRKKNITCCKSNCIKNLLEKNEAALRLFLEEWLQLEKKQKEAVLRFTIRLCSHWSERTVRCVNSKHSRFEFKDPILGSLCRKAFALILDISEATLARHTADVHASGGRFHPSPHENTGKIGHRQIDPNVRQEIINFLVEIASAVGEESSGRHSRRNYGTNTKMPDEVPDSPVIFLPAMYSLKLLYDLYNKKIEPVNFPE